MLALRTETQLLECAATTQAKRSAWRYRKFCRWPNQVDATAPPDSFSSSRRLNTHPTSRRGAPHCDGMSRAREPQANSPVTQTKYFNLTRGKIPPPLSHRHSISEKNYSLARLNPQTSYSKEFKRSGTLRFALIAKNNLFHQSTYTTVDTAPDRTPLRGTSTSTNVCPYIQV